MGAWGPEACLYDPQADEISSVGKQGFTGKRHGGSAVLMMPAQEGKVMVLGGGEDHLLGIGGGRRHAEETGPDHAAGSEPTASVEVFDYGAKTWSSLSPMSYPRHHLGAILLPTGQIWVSGAGGGRFHFLEKMLKSTELHNPETNSWTEAAPLHKRRGYHHVSLLLPEGSVLASGEVATAEVYYPPYFFRGPRPTIRAAPDALNYGESFQLEYVTGSDDPIDQIVLMRQGTMTHSYNFDQRGVTLDFRPEGENTLHALAPESSRHAPPGYYMLFLVSAAGLPSGRATWVQVA